MEEESRVGSGKEEGEYAQQRFPEVKTALAVLY